MTSAEIAAQVAKTRARQGLPTTITDATTLARLAAMVTDTIILEGDRRGPEGRDPPGNRPPEGGRRTQNPAKEPSTPNRTRAAERGQERTRVRRGGGGHARQ